MFGVVEFVGNPSEDASVVPASAESESAPGDSWRAVGALVKSAREAQGLTRVDAAKSAGISASTLATIEAGGRVYKGAWVMPSPTDRTLIRIAETISLDVFALYDAIGRTPPAWWLDPRVDSLRAKAAKVELSALSGKIDQLSPQDRRRVEDLVERLLGED